MERVFRDVIVVFSTTSSKKEAKRIAKALVEKRVAACVSIFGPIKSVYWWKGKVEESEECFLMVKTIQDKYNELEKVIREIHSYQVPEILAVPVVNGLKEYIEWLKKELL